MPQESGSNVYDLSHLRDRVHVFSTRRHAGEIVAGMLEAYRRAEAVVLAIPAGGVPVAAAIAQRLAMPLDVAVVSKITLPWNTEVGYGAVAFDGTVSLNESLLEQLSLSEQEVADGIARTREKVARRQRRFRGDRPMPQLSARTAILVDDGLASGFTMRVAAQALTALAAETIVAVPTAHAGAVADLAERVGAVYCPNIRSGMSFAVADAYRRWRDVSEDEAAAALASFGGCPGR